MLTVLLTTWFTTGKLLSNPMEHLERFKTRWGQAPTTLEVFQVKNLKNQTYHFQTFLRIFQIFLHFDICKIFLISSYFSDFSDIIFSYFLEFSDFLSGQKRFCIKLMRLLKCVTLKNCLKKIKFNTKVQFQKRILKKIKNKCQNPI